jgi:hypothetical protein
MFRNIVHLMSVKFTNFQRGETLRATLSIIVQIDILPSQSWKLYERRIRQSIIFVNAKSVPILPPPHLPNIAVEFLSHIRDFPFLDCGLHQTPLKNLSEASYISVWELNRELVPMISY